MRIKKVSEITALTGDVIDSLDVSSETEAKTNAPSINAVNNELDEITSRINNKIIAEDDGFSKFISNAEYSSDLNNVVKNGFYYGNDLLHAPDSQRYGYLLVIAHNSMSGYATQLFFSSNASGAGLYFRKLANNAWGSWYKLTGTATTTG